MSELHDFGPQKTAAPPPNYLVPAILTTLFCCLPFGIVSIVFGAQVNGKHASGDYAGAVASSQNAKKWAWLSFWFGLVVVIISLVFSAFSVYLAMQQQAPVNQRVQVGPGGFKIEGPGGNIDVRPGGVDIDGPGGQMKVGAEGVDVQGPGGEVKVGEGGVDVQGPGGGVNVEPKPQP